MFETPDCTSSGPPSTTWQSLGFRNIPETAASTLWGFSIALSTPDIKTYRVDLFIKCRRSKFFSSKMMTRFFAKDSALCWKWELLYLSPAAQTYFSKPSYNFILSFFLPCPEISQVIPNKLSSVFLASNKFQLKESGAAWSFLAVTWHSLVK